MTARQLSREDFSELIGEPGDFVDRLLQGREAITLGLARRLAEVIGGSVTFWMTRDRQYRDDVARLRESGMPWLLELPLRDMERLGWISSDVRDGFEVESMLRYFAVRSVSVWRDRYAAVLRDAALRTSPTFESNPAALAAWLRQGERIASSVACGPWDPDALSGMLEEFREYSRIRDPERFLPKLQASAAKCGVVIVVLQAPSKCRASGAVRWLTHDKALLLLSARHLSDDHFWFTLFHELGHLLLHRDTQLFVDEDHEYAESRMEEEANTFASVTLIPEAFHDALVRVAPSTRSVVRLAVHIGISPGILVSQLQRMGRLPQSHLNRLKRRYAWHEGRLVSRENA